MPISIEDGLLDHIERTGTRYGVCVVYPFHAPHPGMPDLFHLRCDQCHAIAMCDEWEKVRLAAIDHDSTHQPTGCEPDHTNGDRDA